MSGKNLTFKLIMDGDSKGLVAAAKQSKDVSKKLFETIESEAEKLKQTSADTAKALGDIVPARSKELADGLTKSLAGATQIIRDAGDNAKSTAKNFTDFGNQSVKSLAFLKSDLETAKKKLEAFSKTKATPADIAVAQKQVDQLENEVQQAESAFIDFHTEVGRANASLKNTDTAAQTAQKGLNGAKFAVTALVGAMAALGVGLGIRELSQVADSYTNLSARINIATKDGGNFTSAMAGVHQVALMTNSSLDATGSLFTRLNAVGKDMGMTQQQALDLTKTVTQAIQIGGGSAQASEAAVQQFIQAMQGGVLRGEEFNSIMENGFGVAEALARGLGVTTGELRKMAENGELSAERVTKALQSQASEVQKTYDQFPTTISNALQRIATSWEILIGKMEQSNGASATVADWLVTIADNMDIVETILKDIGEGFVWVGDQLKKIDPATIEELRSALSTAYETIKSLVVSLGSVSETAALILDTALTSIFNFNSGIDSAEDKTNGLTKALQTASVVFALFNDGFKGIAIVVNLFAGAMYEATGAFMYWKSKFMLGDAKEAAFKEFQDLTARAKQLYKQADDLALNHEVQVTKALDNIGKTREQKTEEAKALSKSQLDQLLSDQQAEVNGKKTSEDEKLKAVQSYAEASIKANNGVMDGVMQADLLTKGYIVTIDEAGKVSVQAGVSAAQAAENAKVKEEALKVAKENVKKADEEYLAYQKQAAVERVLLDKRIEEAKRTGDLNALVSAQTSLTGINTKEAELANNRNMRIAELNQLNSGAGQVAENAVVRARKAAVALGLDLDISLNKVSSKFQEGSVNVDTFVAGLKGLGVTGQQAGEVTYQAWQKWTAEAKSQAELDASKVKLLEFGQQGKLSTAQVEMGLQAIKRASQELPEALSPVEEAMKRLGIQSKEQLKLAAESALSDLETVMKSGEATQDGLQQAYEKTIRLAEASGNAQVIAAANAKAAYLGLEVQLDATGKATVSKLGEIQRAADATQRSVSQVSQPAAQNQPEVSAEKKASDDYWDNFKAEMKAKTDAANARAQAQRSGGRSSNAGSGLTSSNESVYQAPAMPDAPMVASSFDLTPIESIVPKETVEIKIDMGMGQTATVSAAPDQSDALQDMLQQLETLKRST